MTDLSLNDVHSRRLTAIFDTREAAQTALDDLVAAGVSHEHIQLTEGAGPGAGSTVTRDAEGFWDELKDTFLPEQDRYGYAEALRRGGHLLTVHSDEANYARIMDILDRDGAIDMDEREASWRATGWSGYQAGVATSTPVTRATQTDVLNTSTASTGAIVGTGARPRPRCCGTATRR